MGENHGSHKKEGPDPGIAKDNSKVQLMAGKESSEWGGKRGPRGGKKRLLPLSDPGEKKKSCAGPSRGRMFTIPLALFEDESKCGGGFIKGLVTGIPQNKAWGGGKKNSLVWGNFRSPGQNYKKEKSAARTQKEGKKKGVPLCAQQKSPCEESGRSFVKKAPSFSKRRAP